MNNADQLLAVVEVALRVQCATCLRAEGHACETPEGFPSGIYIHGSRIARSKERLYWNTLEELQAAIQIRRAAHGLD